MSFALATALAASMVTVPTCSWDRPGANPFVGDVVAAVDRYTDIPEPVRATLKKRMAARQYDDIAVIRRDAISGKRRYAAEIRDMHFGEGEMCRTVTRTRWRDDAVERGLVYCERGHCIIVPTVCRNVSRIKRLGSDQVANAGDEPGLPEEDLGLAGGPGPAGPGAAAGGGAGGAAGSSGALGGDGSPSMRALSADAGSGGGPGGVGMAGASFDALAGLPSVTLASLDDTVGLVPFAPPSGGAAAGAGSSSSVNTGGSWASSAGTDIPVANPAAAGGVGGTSGLGAAGGAGGTSGLDPFPSPPISSGRGGELTLGTDTLNPEVTAIPEPGTWALWLLGLAGLAARRRRR